MTHAAANHSHLLEGVKLAQTPSWQLRHITQLGQLHPEPR